MKKEETLIQDTIIDYLNENRILHWRISGSSNMSGFPDLLLCYLGYFVALEIKTPVGKPTEQQLKVIEDIKEAQGMAYLVTSVEEVIHILHEIKDDHEGWMEDLRTR